MKITARQFAKSPLEAYRRADRGEEVIITNARYPDIVFRLFARPKSGNNLASTEYINSVFDAAISETLGIPASSTEEK